MEDLQIIFEDNKKNLSLPKGFLRLSSIHVIYEYLRQNAIPLGKGRYDMAFSFW